MKTKVVTKLQHRAVDKPLTGEEKFFASMRARTYITRSEAKDIYNEFHRLVSEAGDIQQAAAQNGCTPGRYLFDLLEQAEGVKQREAKARETYEQIFGPPDIERRAKAAYAQHLLDLALLDDRHLASRRIQ